MKTRLQVNVRPEEIEAAQRAGWHIVGWNPRHHGSYSMFAEWLCDCEPTWPVKAHDTKRAKEAAK